MRGAMRHTHGSIEVVCGSMFSGKTDELIRRLIRATIAKQNVQVFKPAIDVRYGLPRRTVRSYANPDVDCRTRGQAPCDLYGLRRRGFPHTEIGQWETCAL